MFYAIVLGVHVVVCALLILVVLLQSAKGGGLAGGSAFGGGAESTMFGARGAATMLSKATAVFGGLFMLTSLTLTLLGAGRSSSQVRSIVTEEASRAPIPTQTTPPGELPVSGEGALVPPVPGDAPGTPPQSDGEAGPAAGGAETPAPASGDAGGADAGTAEEGQ